MLLIRLAVLPIRIAVGSLLVGYRLGSLLGYRRLVTFGAGVAVGLLLAPTTGQQLRARARAAIGGEGPVPDGELARRVGAELSQSPRTWHLPQPRIEVTAGRVVLRGEVPHGVAAADVERTAAAVPGVVAVDNQLEAAEEPTLDPPATPVDVAGTRPPG